MEPLLERVRGGETLVCDGAMGTLLFAEGLKPGACPERVNLERPELLEDIAARYRAAGADILETNTFGASPMKLAQYGLADRVAEINLAAVRAVRKAADGRAYIAACCGPCGKMLQPYGEADPDAVYDSYLRQLESLFDAGIDVVCVETMIDLTEAQLLIRAAKKLSPDTPVTATMTFDATPRGFFTVMGVSVEQAAAGLTEAGADLVGSNCGNGIEGMVRIAEAFAGCATIPRIIQSNAGLPETVGGALVYRETPEYMADRVGELLAAGVRIVGGCCGTTPDHIRAIRNVVNSQPR